MPKLTLNDICQYRNENMLSTDLSDNVYISTETMQPNREGISSSDIVTPTTKKVKAFYPGDILVSNIRPYFKKIWRATFAGGCSNDVLVFSPKCNSEYLYWLLSTDSFFNYMMATSKGTKMPRGDKKAIMKYIVPDHSDKEQRQIASFLNPLQNKIALNNRINDYLFECCMAKMNNVVGVSNCMMTVGDCCESIYSGGTPSTKNPAYWNGNLPWLSSGETRARFIIDTEKTITELGAAESSTKQAKAGDVVMASAGQGFTRGQTSMLFFDTYVNQSVVVMRPKRDYGAYLLLMLAAQYEELRAWSDSTSTRGSMSGKLLRQFELPYFGAEQAKELMDFATPIFAMIENNMRESKTITRTRDALLPKLMSGEIDVSKIKLSS